MVIFHLEGTSRQEKGPFLLRGTAASLARGSPCRSSKASFRATASHEFFSVLKKKFRASKPVISKYFHLRFLKFSSAEFRSSPAGGTGATIPLCPSSAAPQSQTISAISARSTLPRHGHVSAGARGDGAEGRELSPVTNAV